MPYVTSTPPPPEVSLSRSFQTPTFAGDNGTTPEPPADTCPVMPSVRILRDVDTKAFYVQTPVTIPSAWKFQLQGRAVGATNFATLINNVVAGQTVSLSSLGLNTDGELAYEFRYNPIKI